MYERKGRSSACVRGGGGDGSTRLGGRCQPAVAFASVWRRLVAGVAAVERATTGWEGAGARGVEERGKRRAGDKGGQRTERARDVPPLGKRLRLARGGGRGTAAGAAGEHQARADRPRPSHGCGGGSARSVYQLPICQRARARTRSRYPHPLYRPHGQPSRPPAWCTPAAAALASPSLSMPAAAALSLPFWFATSFRI